MTWKLFFWGGGGGGGASQEDILGLAISLIIITYYIWPILDFVRFYLVNLKM